MKRERAQWKIYLRIWKSYPTLCHGYMTENRKFIDRLYIFVMEPESSPESLYVWCETEIRTENWVTHRKTTRLLIYDRTAANKVKIYILKIATKYQLIMFAHVSLAVWMFFECSSTQYTSSTIYRHHLQINKTILSNKTNKKICNFSSKARNKFARYIHNSSFFICKSAFPLNWTKHALKGTGPNLIYRAGWTEK